MRIDTDIGLSIFIVVFLLAVSFFGGQMGFDVHGVPTEGMNFALAGILFWTGMTSFGIDGAEVFSVVWLVIEILAGLLIVRYIRGQG